MTRWKRSGVRVGWALAWMVWGLFLAPLFIGALGAHPATDDYVFAGITHGTWESLRSVPHMLKDALSYALRTYRDWQGTISGVIVMCLNPAAFSYAYYGVHAAVLLVLWLAALYALLHALLVRTWGLSRGVLWAVYMGMTVLQWGFLPTLVEGLYWHNGAWFYTGTTAVLFILLALLLRGGRVAGGFALGLGVFIGLNNYITAALCCAILTLAVGWMAGIARAPRAQWQRWAGVLAVTLALLIVSVLAPGNRVRMEADAMYGQQSAWLLRTLWWTVRDAAKYTARFLLRTPLLAVLVLCFPLMVRAGRACTFQARYPGWVTLGGYVLLCAMLFPHLFTSGYAGPGRIIDLYHHYVVTVGVLLALYWAIWVSQRGYVVRARWSTVLAAAALCVTLGLCGGLPETDYARLLHEISSGSLTAYREQTCAAYALLENAAPEDVVRVPPEAVTSVTGMQTGGADVHGWQNIALADYFGVAGVVRE